MFVMCANHMQMLTTYQDCQSKEVEDPATMFQVSFVEELPVISAMLSCSVYKYTCVLVHTICVCSGTQNSQPEHWSLKG